MFISLTECRSDEARGPSVNPAARRGAAGVVLSTWWCPQCPGGVRWPSVAVKIPREYDDAQVESADARESLAARRERGAARRTKLGRTLSSALGARPAGDGPGCRLPPAYPSPPSPGVGAHARVSARRGRASGPGERQREGWPSSATCTTMPSASVQRSPICLEGQATSE